MSLEMEKRTNKIVSMLLSQVRQAESAHGSFCAGKHCLRCHEPHAVKIMSMIQQQKPITLILPAFPAKSANRQKTISALPDLGEILSLRNLNELCHAINQWHEPGVQLIICSDGRVFNDLVMVKDEEVDLYQQGIKEIINAQRLNMLSTFSLDEVYPKKCYELMREQLITDYGEELPNLKKRLLDSDDDLYQFNGVHRFVFEDQLALKSTLSRNKVRQMAKETAYQVVRRSNAWSRLLANQFPEAIRLSIHPQPCGSEKLGIQFIPTTNPWATPWHNVLLKQGDTWRLMKRIEAEKLGARLNHDHYVLEGC
jgi:pyoverdine/dityrosine biosynthesis protein Dit1